MAPRAVTRKVGRNPVTRRRVFAAMVIVALGIGFITIRGWRTHQKRPTVVVTKRLNRLEPALASLIQRHVEHVRSVPNDATAHATLGLVYEANGLWTEARACYETAASLQSDQPMWVYHAALMALSSGDFQTGLTELGDTARRFPRFAPAQYRLGCELLRTGALAEAAAAFDRTIAAAPSHSAGYAGLGEVKLHQGDHAAAVRLLERSVQMDPTYKSAHYLLGTAYRSVGRTDEARRELTLGSDATPHYIPDAWSAQVRRFRVSLAEALRTGDDLLSAGRIEAALSIFQQARTFHPDDDRLLTRTGAALLELGRTEEARQALLEARRINAENSWAHVHLATCYLRLNRNEDALAAADAAVSLDKKLWQAQYNRATALARLGKMQEAADALGDAIAVHPDEAMLYSSLADRYVDLGRFSEAEASYDRAMALQPAYIPAYLGAGRLHLRLNQPERARDVLGRALSVAPNDPTIHTLLESIAQDNPNR